MENYRDFLFYDEETGEEFLVQIDISDKPYEVCVEEAKEIANEYFNSPVLQEIISVEAGEWLGLDTY